MQNRWAIGGGATVLLIVAVPLWQGFKEPGNVAWNVFLAIFLLGTVGAATLLQLHFLRHPSEVGEARFETTKTTEDA